MYSRNIRMAEKRINCLQSNPNGPEKNYTTLTTATQACNTRCSYVIKAQSQTFKILICMIKQLK